MFVLKMRIAPSETTTTTTARPAVPLPPTIAVIISSPLISIIDLGETIRLPCQGYHIKTKVPISVRWLKENGLLSETSYEDHGTLVITNAQYGDSGVYICQAQDGRDVIRQKITLAVGSKLNKNSNQFSYHQLTGLGLIL